MVYEPLAQPDITLTLDPDGIIQTAVSSSTLVDEGLEAWLGKPWGETIAPDVSSFVQETIEKLRRSGAPTFVRVRQRFPSGLEIPMEYTTFSLGEAAGFVAIGKNLRVVSELQAKLLLNQQERERDYWKVRDIETRYRMLFDASAEAAILVQGGALRILEANHVAMRSLSLMPGSEFLAGLPENDRKSLANLLETVREHGRGPGIVLHLPPGNAPHRLRASAVNSEAGLQFLFQIAPIGPQTGGSVSRTPVPADELIQRLPLAFVVVDAAGAILRTNDAFLDLAQVGSEAAAGGQAIGRFLAHPGADWAIVSDLVQKHGFVRHLLTTFLGELGTETQVDVSAAGNKLRRPDCIGILIQDASRRNGSAVHHEAFAATGAKIVAEEGLRSLADEDPEVLLDSYTLEQMVRASTDVLERKVIASVLEQCDGNRTRAARRLGLSRQSLHAKLKRYSLEKDA